MFISGFVTVARAARFPLALPSADGFGRTALVTADGRSGSPTAADAIRRRLRMRCKHPSLPLALNAKGLDGLAPRCRGCGCSSY